ncbi:MAG: hypothetical protein KAX65_13300 [Caldilineaceae bacterium]|nr:hypothetical protein [Caldilineaceae bacterium]
MSMADVVAGVLCLVLPLATMLVAIAALTWTRREFVAMLRKWIDAK